MSRKRKKDPLQKLTSILVALRNDLGLRQVDLAKRLDRPQSFVSKYESGERRLDVFELNEICIALHISLSEVIIRVEQDLK